MPADATLFITHAEGGGIERHLRERLRALHESGQPWLVLRPFAFGTDAVLQSSSQSQAERRFSLPADTAAMDAALRAMACRIEVHHLRSHHATVKALPERLGLPYSVTLHDHALICPRANLTKPDGRYCGEPELAACEGCISGYAGAAVASRDGVAALRRASGSLLRGAAEVIAPSPDARRRMLRHFPGLAIQVGEWEAPAVPITPVLPPLPRVCVAGNLTRAKGFDVLLGCARDAAERRLPLDFVLLGRSLDNAALEATGRCTVLGPYPEEEGPAWVAAQRGAIGFLPSLYPEPWCYALGVLQRAGLPLAAFDLGAQSMRVRKAEGTLLPLGMTSGQINDVFLGVLRSVGFSATHRE